MLKKIYVSINFRGEKILAREWIKRNGWPLRQYERGNFSCKVIATILKFRLKNFMFPMVSHRERLLLNIKKHAATTWHTIAEKVPSPFLFVVLLTNCLHFSSFLGKCHLKFSTLCCVVDVACGFSEYKTPNNNNSIQLISYSFVIQTSWWDFLRFKYKYDNFRNLSRHCLKGIASHACRRLRYVCDYIHSDLRFSFDSFA